MLTHDSFLNLDAGAIGTDVHQTMGILAQVKITKGCLAAAKLHFWSREWLESSRVQKSRICMVLPIEEQPQRQCKRKYDNTQVYRTPNF